MGLLKRVPWPLRRLLFRLLSTSPKAASSTARSSRERRFRTTAETGEGGPLLQVAPRVPSDGGPATGGGTIDNDTGGGTSVVLPEVEVPGSDALFSNPFCTSEFASSLRSSVKKIPWLASAFSSASASSGGCEGNRGAEHEAQVDGKANKVVDFDLQYCSSVLHLFNS